MTLNITEACTIKIQHINDSSIPNTVPDVLVLTDLMLLARDKTAIAYSSLSATLSSTNKSFPIQNCFDNNSKTRWALAARTWRSTGSRFHTT
jgi:hypothetical protein